MLDENREVAMRRALTVVAMAVIAASAFATAHAATRTPTPTPTPTPLPTVTSTPSPAFAAFSGQPWVNAHVTTDPVTAKIGGTLCGTATFMAPPGGGPFYRLEVASAQAISGCGVEGAEIAFFVGDRQAPQTAVWHAGESERLNLIIGPPFAEFAVSGTGAESITPYINGKACGYGGVVYSAEQEPGCGVEGSQVTFKRADAFGNVSFERGVWHAWDGVSIPLPVTPLSGPSSGVGLPPTGDTSGENGWSGSPLIWLGFAGLGATVVGLALRKVVATR
jgi:hypothetical protein